GAPDVVLAAPARALPQPDRRAVGRTMRWMGHVLDAVALTLPLMVLSRLNNGAVPVRIILSFGAIGTLLLWNTHKRGRTIVSPSEALTTVVTRIALAVVITSTTLGIIRWNLWGGINPKDLVDVAMIIQVLV